LFANGASLPQVQSRRYASKAEASIMLAVDDLGCRDLLA
jgi:hypothetical protein